MADKIMNCPECGKSYNVSTFNPGMKFRCTKCNKVVTVPDDEPEVYDDRGREPRRSSRAVGAPPPSKRGSRRPAKRRRDEFDEEDMGHGRDKPKKSDNTLYIGLGAAVGIIILIAGIMTLFKTQALQPSVKPPEEMGTESGTQFRTANYDANPVTTNPLNSGKSYLNDSEKSDPQTTQTDGRTIVKPNYSALSDCSDEVKKFVAGVVEKAGGEEALKFNKSCIMQVNIRTNCHIALDRPDDPYAWLSETDMPSTFYWKRDGGTNKMIYEQRQASRVVWQAYNGTDFVKYIDKDKTDTKSGESRRFMMDAYDFDVMHKLASGRFLIVNEVRTRKQFEFGKVNVLCDIIRVQDRLDKSIELTLYFFESSSPDGGMLAKIQYKDEINKENVNKFYWNYYEKNKMKFPLMTLINRSEILEDNKKGDVDVRIFQIFKDDADELGDITFGAEISDYLFERPKD